MYGTPGEDPKVCPGETNCQRFQSSAGKSHREKEQNACSPCEMLQTKLAGGQKIAVRNAGLVDAAMDIRNERLAGYPRPTWLMSTLQFRTLLIVEQIVEQQEVWLRREQGEILKAVFGGNK